MKKISLLAVFCLLTMAFYNASLVKGEESYYDLGLTSLLLTANADSESSGSGCDQCVVKDPDGNVIYSCKTVQGETCSKEHPDDPTITLRCNDSSEC